MAIENIEMCFFTRFQFIIPNGTSTPPYHTLWLMVKDNMEEGSWRRRNIWTSTTTNTNGMNFSVVVIRLYNSFVQKHIYSSTAPTRISDDDGYSTACTFQKLETEDDLLLFNLLFNTSYLKWSLAGFFCS